MADQHLSSDSDRKAARRRIAAKRRSLSETERRHAEQRVAHCLRHLPAMRRARHVSVYLAVNGELALDAFIARASSRAIQLYAPVLNGDELRFGLLEDNTPLKLNGFGIPEPLGGPYIDPRSLDIVLTPLVGFDERGVRLGMGGGYYDRSFRFLGSRSNWRKPKLVGIGFEFQYFEKIKPRDWDIGLSNAVTETELRSF
ncbi:MAG: 5-formyltetrahydrofolate cyclo-ligase [Gammaproteobacteria bacterium]